MQLYEGSSLQTAYHHHLSNALVTYQKIIADLDSKFGYGPSGITELQGRHSKSCDCHMTFSLPKINRVGFTGRSLELAQGNLLHSPAQTW